jgi:hypothetical protein
MGQTSTDAEDRSSYLSYLLRLWQESKAERIWRASLENISTGERRGFASLDDLFGFLCQQAVAASESRPEAETTSKEVTL